VVQLQPMKKQLVPMAQIQTDHLLADLVMEIQAAQRKQKR